MRRPIAPALLDAADRLFYRHGVRGVGIDAILAATGASSRSLYQHFGSKEGLAAAALSRRSAAWLAALKADVERRAADPAARLLALFDALAAWFREPGFHGCGFVNVAGEFAAHDHPLRGIAAAHKRAVLAFITDMAREAGFVAPSRLARELFLLVEGATAAALVLNAPDAAASARRAAAALIAAQTRPA